MVSTICPHCGKPIEVVLRGGTQLVEGPSIKERASDWLKKQEAASGATIWETRMPKNAQNQRPYEFTSDTATVSKIRGLIRPGSYSVVLEGYKYWVMQNGVGRRRVT